MRYSASWKV